MPAQYQGSGFFGTPTSTPTGAPKAIAVDNPYLTKDDFILTAEAQGLGITATSSDNLYTSGELDKLILRASAQVNRICARYFDVQTIDETRTGFTVRPYNPRLVTVNLKNSPYQKINSIYIQVLKWFIPVDITSGYLQDFPDFGYYKIVPLLSQAGTGVSSPIPAEILDRVPLGVLWTNYTFGFGQANTGYTLNATNVPKQYQAPDLFWRLWAPSQTVNIYDNGTKVASSNYTVDYPNGSITFISSYSVTGPITADFTTNSNVPQDIKEAVILLVSDIVGRALQNPLGLSSVSMLSHSMSFDNTVIDRVKSNLTPYHRNSITII